MIMMMAEMIIMMVMVVILMIIMTKTNFKDYYLVKQGPKNGHG